MATELLFGIQTNCIRHAEADGMLDIDTTFRMVKEACVHYCVDKHPTRMRLRNSKRRTRSSGCRCAPAAGSIR